MARITPELIEKWADVGMLLLTHGLVGAKGIIAAFKSMNPEATDEELNAMARAVQERARKAKAISDAIVTGG